jgi:hypothetical protein
MAKGLVWRLQGIHAMTDGRPTTPKDVVEFFEYTERKKIKVQTLCHSLDDAEELTATVEHFEKPGTTEHALPLRDDISKGISSDYEFRGFTPLHFPTDYDAE